MSLAHMVQNNWLINSTCALWIKPYIKWSTCAQILTHPNPNLNQLANYLTKEITTIISYY